MRLSNIGQSFAEYLILVGLVVGVVMFLANGPVKDGTRAVFEKSTDAVEAVADQAN